MSRSKNVYKKKLKKAALYLTALAIGVSAFLAVRFSSSKYKVGDCFCSSKMQLCGVILKVEKESYYALIGGVIGARASIKKVDKDPTIVKVNCRTLEVIE